MNGEQPTGQVDTEPAHAAPEHLVDLLLGVMRPYPGQPGTEGSISHARMVRAEAKFYADRIWNEAYNAGAQWGLERNVQPIRLQPAEMDRLVRALA